MSTDLEDIFYAGKRTEVLPFVIGERVIVISGERSGATAWVVGLDLTREEVRYRIEYQDGSTTPRFPRELKTDEEKA